MSDFKTVSEHSSMLNQIELERGLPILQFAVWGSASECHIIGEERIHNAAALSTKQAADDAGLQVLLHPVDADDPTDASFVVVGPPGCRPLRLRNDDPNPTGAPSF